MKPLKALISKNTMHRAHSSDTIWPNPYNLTEKDAKGEVEGYPLEIITLAMKEEILQHPQRTITNSLELLQELGVGGVFTWDQTKDGKPFWNPICYSRFDEFYKKYTPKLLKKD